MEPRAVRLLTSPRVSTGGVSAVMTAPSRVSQAREVPVSPAPSGCLLSCPMTMEAGKENHRRQGSGFRAWVPVSILLSCFKTSDDCSVSASSGLLLCQIQD